MRPFGDWASHAVYALRTMRKNPVFALTAILTLAIGISGNTAMFTVIRAVLLKPLNYSDPDKLVQISQGATPTRFEDLKTSARSFSGIVAFTPEEDLTLTGGTEPEVLKGVRVSASFLEMLGVKPILGHSFSASDDSPAGTPVAMISAELWKNRFNGDPQIAGKTVVMAAAPYTIIGVLPPHFQFPSPGIQVWTTQPADWPLMPPKSRLLSPFLTLVGRLKPGIDIAPANAETVLIHHRYALAHPAMLDAKSKSPAELKPLKDELVSDIRAMLWMLFGAVSFVLLITCANVASILLARAASRTQEFAIRSALGASRRHLLKQLLAEGILLSSAGGVIGVCLAALSIRAIPRMTAIDLPRLGDIHLDWVVLAFAATISMAAGIIFGLVPSLGASRLDLIRVLRGSGEAASKGIPKRVLFGLDARALLVVGQVALSMVLLIGAALLMESLGRLRGADLGFNPAHLLTFRISLPPSRYETDQKRASLIQDVVHAVEAGPGVRSATAAMFLPMTGFVGSPVQDAGKPPLRLNLRPIATLLVVAPAYFRTLAIPMRRGRDFTERDRSGTERVAIIDEAMARRLWPAYPNGQNPVGQHLLIGGVNAQPAQIIGIVAGVHQNIENSAWPETVYVSFAQDPPQFAMFAVRTEGEPLRYVSMVRAQLHELDRDQPISDIKTMDDLVDAELGQRQLIVGLLGSFAGVALLLALIGLYGVIAYSVAQRAPELAIRRALGAQKTDILWLVMSQGVALTIAGILIGVAGALALGRVLTSLLFETKASDPATFAGIGALFILAALAATYIPARRATSFSL